MKAAKSCLEKGSDYAKNEVLRLERMLAKVNSSSLTILIKISPCSVTGDLLNSHLHKLAQNVDTMGLYSYYT